MPGHPGFSEIYLFSYTLLCICVIVIATRTLLSPLCLADLDREQVTFRVAGI